MKLQTSIIYSDICDLQDHTRAKYFPASKKMRFHVRRLLQIC